VTTTDPPDYETYDWDAYRYRFQRADVPLFLLMLTPIIGAALHVDWYWYPLAGLFWLVLALLLGYSF
jgi:hypothetical protein